MYNVYISMVPYNNLYQKWSIKRIFFVISVPFSYTSVAFFHPKVKTHMQVNTICIEIYLEKVLPLLLIKLKMTITVQKSKLYYFIHMFSVSISPSILFQSKQKVKQSEAEL